MKTRVLTAADVRQLLQEVGLDAFVDLLLARTETAFRSVDASTHAIPIRAGFNYTTPVEGLVEFMPVHEFGDVVTQKAVAYHPRNPGQNLPTILSSVSVYDVRTGHLDALIDGVMLTALRTGVASALASRLLASPTSRTLGIIGCGAQGVAQVHALSRVLPIERLLVYDTDAAVQQSYAARLASIGIELPLSFVPPSVILRDSDVITTATSVGVGAGPVVEDGPHQPHLHINAVGSDFPGKVECPLSLLRRAEVIPDFPGQAVVEGECQRLAQEEIGPDLVSCLRDGKDRTQQLTVFDSTGWALEDHITARVFLERAEALGVGHTLALESIPSDPYNPFS